MRIAKRDTKYKKDKHAILEKEKGKMLAYMFMSGAHKKSYGGLMKKLQDDHALGDINIS